MKIKNRSVIILYFILSFFPIIAQSNPLIGWEQDINPDSHIAFKPNIIEFTQFGDTPIIQKIPYEYKEIDNISYISLVYSGGWFSDEVNQGNQKWLILFNENILFAYSGELIAPINQGIMGRYLYSIGISHFSYDADSYLQEKSIAYTPDNLGDTKTYSPWVEGVSGTGIGQKIYIRKDQPSARDITGLLFSNGFVSYDNPYLYSANSRVKKIKITNKSGSIEETVDLTDSHNIQFLLLPEKSSDVIIEILDTYPGLKWEDTCINFIIPYEG